jgi:hypothetical protein
MDSDEESPLQQTIANLQQRHSVTTTGGPRRDHVPDDAWRLPVEEREAALSAAGYDDWVFRVHYRGYAGYVTLSPTKRGRWTYEYGFGHMVRDGEEVHSATSYGNIEQALDAALVGHTSNS